MSIDPKVAFWFGVLTSILLMIASAGTNFFAGALPAEYIPFIVKWCSILGTINSCVLTAANGYSGPGSGPLVKAVPSFTPTVVKVLLVAFVLSFLVASNSFANVS